jgi:hypothetical protein
MDPALVLKLLAEAEQQLSSQRELIAKLEQRVAERERFLQRLGKQPAVAMSQKVQQCLDSASRCEGLVSEVPRPDLKISYAWLAGQWRHLAEQTKQLEEEQARRNLGPRHCRAAQQTD